jgi:hypothetical protein
MANRYGRSSDGSDADNGTTWALAKATTTGLAAIDAAGDNLYLSSVHSESTASPITLAFAGVNGNPTRLLSVNDGAEPPTAFSYGATIATTGGNAITISGWLYAEGVSFTTSSSIQLCSGGGSQVYSNCKFKTTNTGSSGTFTMPQTNIITHLKLINTTLYFSNAANKFIVQHSLHIQGGSMESGSSTPTSLFHFGADGRGGKMLVEGFDFSGFGSTMNLIVTTPLASGTCVFRNCKLPASWSGSLVASSTSGPGLRISMYNCDSTDTNYRLWIEDNVGSIKSETTLIKTGGASDGTTGISWKMVSNVSYANEVFNTLDTDDIAVWNETTGSAVTLTVDILRDSATNLKDSEIWLEVQSLNTSGYPLSGFTNDCRTDIFATAADQTSSSATWTTTGMSNPNKQKLSVTVTPQEKGWIFAKVRLAKLNTTVYVDPVLQVS